mmetsp:Transcript_32418/g.96675  ORF Transcript_32418/g.96675 Transcript_32418/m.96675 type:complete len:434 (+) Transcript_32418:166-1467(+)
MSALQWLCDVAIEREIGGLGGGSGGGSGGVGGGGAELKRPGYNKYKVYKCKRCGAPKKGHICLAKRQATLAPSGTPGITRKEWSREEDRLILLHAKEKGLKWRLIAELIPGRSDDAVRNRWNRLQGDMAMPEAKGGWVGRGDAAARAAASPASSPTHPAPAVSSATAQSEAGAASPPLASSASPQPRPSGQEHPPPSPASPRAAPASPRAARAKQPDRTGWSTREDAIIAASVAELGHRWFLIAQRLPNRTDHAIRNRWHRLQTMQTEQAQQRYQQGNRQLLSEHGVAATGQHPVLRLWSARGNEQPPPQQQQHYAHTGGGMAGGAYSRAGVLKHEKKARHCVLDGQRFSIYKGRGDTKPQLVLLLRTDVQRVWPSNQTTFSLILDPNRPGAKQPKKPGPQPPEKLEFTAETPHELNLWVETLQSAIAAARRG